MFPNKHKIKFIHYVLGHEIRVCVHIIEVNSENGRFAIVFQRRQGDCLYFCQLFNSFRERLSQYVIGYIAMPEHYCLPMIPDNIPIQLQLQTQSQLQSKIDDCISSMLRMSNSVYYENSIEGILALSNTYMSDCSLSIMIDVCKMFLNNLLSERSDIRRTSALGLANLLENVSTERYNILFEQITDAHLEQLYLMRMDVSYETRKQTIRILNLVDVTIATEIYNCINDMHLFGDIYNEPFIWVIVAGYVQGGIKIEKDIWPYKPELNKDIF